MAKFLDHREFVGNPSVEELKASKITKNRLKYIASGFEIPFQHDIRKDDLMTLILLILEKNLKDSRWRVRLKILISF